MRLHQAICNLMTVVLRESIITGWAAIGRERGLAGSMGFAGSDRGAGHEPDHHQGASLQAPAEEAEGGPH